MPIENERFLLRQIAENDEKAFAVVVENYWNNIYAQALTYLKSREHAQDVVQEVFVKLWEKRSLLRAVERFDSFLFILARNQIISELRKKLAAPPGVHLKDNIVETTDIPDLVLASKEFQETIAKAIELLPPQQKMAFLLSRDEGLTYEQIALEMQVSKETVKKHVCRALNFLRTQIQTHSEIVVCLLFAFIF